MNQREASKKNWGLFSKGESATIEEINAGSLQRIADATEILTSKHVQMSKDLDWYKKKYDEHGEEIKALRKLNSSYKGVITRMKNKALKSL